MSWKVAAMNARGWSRRHWVVPPAALALLLLASLAAAASLSEVALRVEGMT